MIPSRLDRYIGARILVATLWVYTVLAALFVFFSVVDALGDYGHGRFGLVALIHYVLLSQPRRLYEILPVAAVIGASLGLATLAFSSEITAMRAAGLSPGRIVRAALQAALVLAAIGFAFGEYVVPQAEGLAQLQRAQALQAGLSQRGGGIWLRDGREFVNIGEVLSDLSLARVQIYWKDEAAGGLDAQLYARRARYDTTTRRWWLDDVRISRLSGRGVTIEKIAAREWQTGITPDLVAVFATEPASFSLIQLDRFIAHLEGNRLDTRHYRLAFWQKLLMPLAVAVMVLAATAFVFRPVRSGGLAQRVLIGVMLGLGFLVLERSVGNLALLYGLSPFWAAATPLLFFLFLSLFLLKRVAR
jgi:lipopolysaccharide export system permease protein